MSELSGRAGRQVVWFPGQDGGWFRARMRTEDSNMVSAETSAWKRLPCSPQGRGAKPPSPPAGE